jgi:uncharacterized protein YdaU (DUF1376 family)
MASNKDPAFLFYSADFLVGVSDLTMEERGQYITLICLQHQKGRLNDRIIALSIPNVSEYVLAKFDKDENGLYYNKRVEEEIEKRNKYITAQRENGAKGGRPKTRGFELAKAKQNPSENENENKNVNKSINSITNISSLYIDLFNTIWSIYPRKEGKQYAMECFARLNPCAELAQTIKAAVERAKRSKQWQDKQFIPHFSTYLNQRRWEDELPEEEMSSFDTDDFFQAALERSARKIAERAKG